MQIMRCELEIPAKLSRLRIQRHHGIRVQVVALSFVAVVVGTWIPSRPVDKIRRRIVGAREPGINAAMLNRFPDPRFRQRLAGSGHGPESPSPLSGRSSVRIDESTRAFIATRSAGNNEVI